MTEKQTEEQRSGDAPLTPLGLGHEMSLGLFILVAALIAVAVFVLPWHVPVPGPIVSLSYDYGFSNGTAILAVGAALALLAGYRLWFVERDRRETDGFSVGLLKLFSPPNSTPVPRSLEWSFCIVSVGVVAVIGWFFSIFPYAYYGETPNFLNRFDAMILGLRPFKDFEFAYGPGMLWPCLWLYKLCPALSVETCYGVVLLLHWVIGFCFLFYIIRALNFKARSGVFIIFALTCFNLTLGLNYTPARFLLPVASLFFAHRLVGHSERLSGLRIIQIWAASVCLPLLSFFISPEMGVTLTLAFVTYFISLARAGRRPLAWCAIGAVLALPISAALYSRAYFYSLFTFGGGGNSFPIYPTLHILFFLLVIFTILPRLAVMGINRRDVTGSFFLAICVLSSFLIVPALGRCDYGHVFWNSALLMLLFVGVASESANAAFRRGTIGAFILFFTVLGPVIFWNHYDYLLKGLFNTIEKQRDQPSGDQMEALRQIAPTAAPSPFRYSKLMPWGSGLEVLLNYGKLATPFGVPETIERFLKLTSRFAPYYYLAPMTQICTQGQLRRNLADLDAMPVIMIPKFYLTRRDADIDLDAKAEKDSEFLSKLMLFPVYLDAGRAPFLPQRAVKAKIIEDYVLTAELGQFVIMTRKSGASPLP